MRDTTVETRAIRVLVDGADWLAEAVEKTLDGLPDMELIGPTPRKLTLVGRHERADVIVTSLTSAALRQKYRTMFFGQDGVPIVAISEDRQRVEVYDRWLIRQVDFPHLAAAIREVAHRERNVLTQQSE